MVLQNHFKSSIIHNSPDTKTCIKHKYGYIFIIYCLGNLFDFINIKIKIVSFCTTSYTQEKEMMFQNIIYVILKVWNRRLIFDEELPFSYMSEPHMFSIWHCQCSSYICNINENIEQNVGPVLLKYFHTALIKPYNCLEHFIYQHNGATYSKPTIYHPQ